MILTNIWAVFAVGVAGGVVAEVFHWWNLRLQTVLPDYVRRPFYWFLTVLMALLGGLVAILYFGQSADGILALHVGASTPLLLQKFVTSVPERGGAKALAGGPTVRRFFRW
jgi:hypothetical protein